MARTIRSQRWLDAVLARRPLGVLFVLCSPTQAQQAQLRRQDIPFVVVDTDSATTASVPTVGSNNWNGGLLATRHLLGARPPPDRDHLRARRRAVQPRAAGRVPRRARGGRDPEIEPDLVCYGTFHLDAGYEHGMALLERADRPTAVFAGSDMQALGVLRAARQLGIDVPGGLSVIGYDNLEVAAWTDPALTTIDQPIRDMAGTAAHMVLDLARGRAACGPAGSIWSPSWSCGRVQRRPRTEASRGLVRQRAGEATGIPVTSPEVGRCPGRSAMSYYRTLMAMSIGRSD